MSFVIKKDALTRREPEGLERWVEYQPGVKFLIRGLSHRFVQVGMEAKREQQSHVYQRYNVGDRAALEQGKTREELGNEMLGELIVADWKGLSLEDGSALSYAPETATAIFSAPEYQDLAVWAMAQSVEISKEFNARVEKRMGKSLSATAGKRENPEGAKK